jgi:hypothetical protein
MRCGSCQSDGQVCLAGARRAYQQNVGCGFQVAAGAQLIDQAAVDPGGGVQFELGVSAAADTGWPQQTVTRCRWPRYGWSSGCVRWRSLNGPVLGGRSYAEVDDSGIG